MLIEIERLKKRFIKNDFLLSISKLSISQGETIGIVGNNGAGKTTFLRLLLDLLKPDEGIASILGVQVDKNDKWKNYVGAYLDDYSLIDFLTVEEYFDFVIQINKIDKQVVENQFACMKNFYKPAEFKGKKLISQYSTGNKHKIGIVSALLSCPKIVVLDEPFANLDPTSQIALKKIIKILQTDFQTTFLVSSHNLDHVVEISNRVLLFENGKIIYDDLVSAPIMDKLVKYFNNQLPSE